ncbi:MAG TPA: hypothetical protein PKD82_15635, partial [Amaricoccus sp.]|nr:hypothetical protein [Amaricoccus sp.]
MMTQIRSLCHAPGAAAAALTLAAAAVGAHELTAEAGNAERAAFDIVAADIATDGRHAIFTMSVAGTPGEDRPEAAGGLAGAPVFSYVWPTTLDPSVVGFEAGAGILAFINSDAAAAFR